MDFDEDDDYVESTPQFDEYTDEFRAFEEAKKNLSSSSSSLVMKTLGVETVPTKRLGK